MTQSLAVRPADTKEFFTLNFPDRWMKEMQTMHDEVARAAFGIFNQRGRSSGSALEDWLLAEAQVLKPVSVSITDETNQILVRADVPGFSIDEIKVHVEGQNLSICGTSESKKTGEEQSTSSRKICCEVMLPAPVKATEASATLDKGVLTLVLPKAEPSREIQVKAAA